MCDEIRGFCRVYGDRTDLPAVGSYAVADEEVSSVDDMLGLLAIAVLDAQNELVFMVTRGTEAGRVLRPAEYDHETDQPGDLFEWFPTLGEMLASLRIRRAGLSGYA
jgi:hypothetical protein